MDFDGCRAHIMKPLLLFFIIITALFGCGDQFRFIYVTHSSNSLRFNFRILILFYCRTLPVNNSHNFHFLWQVFNRFVRKQAAKQFALNLHSDDKYFAVKYFQFPANYKSSRSANSTNNFCSIISTCSTTVATI